MSVCCWIHLDFLTELDTVISKAQDVVTKIRQSRILTENLEKKIKQNHPNTTIKRLISNNITRWGSTFLMLSRLLFLKNEVEDLISNEDISKKYDIIKPNDEDWRRFEIIYIFLKKFYYYNLLIEAGNNPSMHFVTEAYTVLYTHCQYFIDQLDGKAENNEIVRSIIKASNILTRYFNLGSIFHFAANILDPRAKMYIYQKNSWIGQGEQMVDE